LQGVLQSELRCVRCSVCCSHGVLQSVVYAMQQTSATTYCLWVSEWHIYLHNITKHELLFEPQQNRLIVELFQKKLPGRQHSATHCIKLHLTVGTLLFWFATAPLPHTATKIAAHTATQTSTHTATHPATYTATHTASHTTSHSRCRVVLVLSPPGA